MKQLRELTVQDFENPEMRKTIENSILLLWQHDKYKGTFFC